MEAAFLYYRGDLCKVFDTSEQAEQFYQDAVDNDKVDPEDFEILWQTITVKTWIFNSYDRSAANS